MQARRSVFADVKYGCAVVVDPAKSQRMIAPELLVVQS